MRHLTTIIIGCIILTAKAQTMTLKECVERGLACNLSLDNTRIEKEKGSLGVSQNKAKLLPTIIGFAQTTDYLKCPVNVTTGTLLGSDFPDNPTWQAIRSMKYNTQAGIQFTMPLYNQTILAAIDVARTVENIGQLKYEKAVEELTLQLARIYYLAQASLEQLQLTDDNIVRMTELYAITEALYNQGMVMDVDLERVRIDLTMLKTERTGQHTLHEQQLNMLRFLMDMNEDEALEVEAHFQTLSGETCISGDGVSGELPELRIAAKQKELAEKSIKSTKAAYLPSLSFTGYVGGVGYNEKLSLNTGHWYGNCFVGISLRVPIFEANSRKLKIRQQRLDAQQAAISLTLLQKQLDKQYADAALQQMRNLEILQAQTECLRQAAEMCSITEEQYKEGIASMTALLQDEMQLRTAQSAYVQANCQYRLAELEMSRLKGKILKI